MARYGYAFTLNNYAPAHELKLQGAIGQVGVTYIVYGREVGEQGTPHLQGYLQSNQKNKERFHSKLGVFVTPQQRTATNAMEYCKKDGNFFEAGEFNASIKGTMEKSQGKRSDLEAVKARIANGESYEEIAEAEFDTAARFHQFIKERVQARDSMKQLSTLRLQYESSVLRPWQQALLDVCEETACPRKIHWIWEDVGNMGKSWMAKYLLAMKDACYLTYGKKADLAYIFAQKPTKIVVINLSRTSASDDEEKNRKHHLDGLYGLAEDLKDGVLLSGKYQSVTKIFQVPHVIFFANFEPDYSKWSGDRYNVMKLN